MNITLIFHSRQSVTSCPNYEEEGFVGVAFGALALNSPRLEVKRSMQLDEGWTLRPQFRAYPPAIRVAFANVERTNFLQLKRERKKGWIRRFPRWPRSSRGMRFSAITTAALRRGKGKGGKESVAAIGALKSLKQRSRRLLVEESGVGLVGRRAFVRSRSDSPCRRRLLTRTTRATKTTTTTAATSAHAE